MDADYKADLTPRVQAVEEWQEKEIWVPRTGTAPVSAASSSETICTINDSRITADMECTASVIGNPSAQTSDWTVTTSAGEVVVTGTCSAATTLQMKLEVKNR